MSDTNVNEENEQSRRRGVVLSKALVFTLLLALSSVAMGSFVMLRSTAAFSDTTNNTTNVLGAGTVDLVDNDSTSAMFNVTNMKPGDTVVDCIIVTYQGTIADPTAVRLYSGGYTDSGTFATHLNLTIEEGTGGTFDNCTGFTSENTIESGGTLSAFNTAHTNYTNGAGVWDPTGTPQSKTYRFTFTLDAATPNAQQGESVSALIFTWETQS